MRTIAASHDRTAPSLRLLLREAAQLINWRRITNPSSFVPDLVGNGRPVLVVPGFLASDGSTRPLRMALRAAGFRTYRWKNGRNLGLKSDIFERIDARMERIARECNEPVAIVGWSLGGLVAREYAKYAPDRVARVITLGSPFSGDIRANNVWRLYELVARHKVDCPPIECALTEKPPVETIAIWSRQDGIVAPACARGLPQESDADVEVGCGHIEFTYAPEALRAVIAALR